MSTQIESIFDYQAPVSKNKNAQKSNQQETQGAVAAFASFLVQNTANSSAFSRLSANLELPKASQATPEKFAAPDRAQNHSQPQSEQTATPDRQRDKPSLRDKATPTRDNTPSERPSEHAVANRPADKAATAPNRAETAAQRPNASPTAQAHANANSAVQNQMQEQVKPALQASETAKNAVASKGQAADTATTTKASNNAPANTPATAPNSENAIKASVTTQGGAIASKPTSNLSAESSVAADAGEGSTSNIFTKASSQNSGSGGNNQQQGQAGNQNGQNANAAQAMANASTPTQQQQLPSGGGFNNAVAAAQAGIGGREAAIANLGGSSGQVASVDPLTGATSIEGQNGNVQRASTPAASHARRPQVPPQVIADQVAVNIQRAAGQGADRINIQLRPLELGRIEVKMEMGQDGRMTATISAERPETLDMLRNDARSLIQTLNDAGLQTDANSLNFNLQGQDNSGQQQAAKDNQQSSSPNGEEFSLDGEDTPTDDSPLLAAGEDVVLDDDGHLNVRV